jgi:hypothetical protein
LVAILLLVPVQLFASVNAQEDGPECWAVIIGITNYQNITNLMYAEDDARDLANQLKPIWGEDHIKLLTNSMATKEGIENAITDWLDSREDSDDTVLFFWSGRYYYDGYLIAHNAEQYGTNNCIYANELDTWLGSLESDKIVAMGIPSRIFPDVLSETGRIILSPSAADENSWSTEDLGHGVFDYYILEALSEFEETDSDNNYELTVEEIFDYAETRTTDYTASYSGINTQHPQIADRYSGELSLLIKVTADAEIGITQETDVLSIDGKEYSSRDLPESFIWSPGSHHEFEAMSPIPDGNEIRYVFNSWDDGNSSISRTISTGGVFSANYKDQYYLHVNSDYGQPEGEDWYDSGSTAGISVNTPVEDAGIKYVFNGWSGDYSGDTASASVLMDKPKTVSADWRTEYLLTVESDHDQPEGAGWYDSGSTAEISIGTLVEESATKYFFTGWSGDYSGDTASASVLMDKPKTVSADWRTEYLLTVESEYSEPEGSGWYDAGSTAEISVKSPVGMIVRQVFTGWTGDYSVDTAKASIIIDGPKMVTANWRTDYLQLYILIIVIVLILGGLGAWFMIRRRKARRVLSETAQPPTSPMRCPNCGANIEPGDTFCVNCGKPVN